LYCRARAEARNGDLVGALKDLRVVLEYNLEQGLERLKEDDAFEDIRENEDLKKIINECTERLNERSRIN